MKRLLPLCLPALVMVSACGSRSEPAVAPSKAATSATLAFANAPGGGETEAADSLIMRAQVALDRLAFSPGVIDGREGQSYKLALAAFQEARGLPSTGQLDPATQAALFHGQGTAATLLVVIPEAFARGPFVRDLPHKTADLAGYDHLGYRSMTEALAERFHTTPDTLVALNGPNTALGTGRTIRVPAIANVAPAKIEGDERGWADTLQRLGVAGDQPEAERIVVDKSQGTLRVYDKADKLIAQFPVTTGSAHDPLPIGTWKIRGTSRNPDYQYDPDLFWDANKNDKAKRLAPGPNGPVGVVWIDLSKDHYGIHGTPEPQTIGRSESHGCVRLTNWDAARLAQMVHTGTNVVFQP
ncbi:MULTISPECIES: L,D-transpeptidase family protein [unclassified Novosphingobium]|uniref:L,D-transpeptidase family protein n=2 Tax=unclassified Novosphingobium TaxID=2644732 RepID=UPI001F1CFDF4|nr:MULTISPECIES: L,D-transpeptidase family protein [unclassified Novosphingobium]